MITQCGPDDKTIDETDSFTGLSIELLLSTELKSFSLLEDLKICVLTYHCHPEVYEQLDESPPCGGNNARLSARQSLLGTLACLERMAKSECQK